jgi:hypothetical protein
MAEPVIKLKRSAVPGKVPEAEDLEFGELAINYNDGALYYKKSDGTVNNITAGGGGVDALINAIATEKAIVMAIALG